MAKYAHEKVEAFAARILQECEQEGFTISEAMQLPTVLQHTIQDRVGEMHRELRISTSAQDAQETY